MEAHDSDSSPSRPVAIIPELMPEITADDMLNQYSVWLVPVDYNKGFFVKEKHMVKVCMTLSNLIFEECAINGKKTFHDKIADVKIMAGAVFIVAADIATRDFLLNVFQAESMQYKDSLDFPSIAVMHKKANETILASAFAIWIPNDREQLSMWRKMIESRQMPGIVVDKNWYRLPESFRKRKCRGAEGLSCDFVTETSQAKILAEHCEKADASCQMYVKTENYQFSIIPILKIKFEFSTVTDANVALMAKELNMSAPKNRKYKYKTSIIQLIAETNSFVTMDKVENYKPKMN